MPHSFRSRTLLGTFAVAIALACGTSASAAPNSIHCKIGHTAKPDKGFLFHLTGRVDGAKGVPCHVAVFIMNKENQPYKARDKTYANDQGALCTWAEFTPPNDQHLVTHELYLPYSAMIGQGGSYDITVHAVIWCPSQKKYLGLSTPETSVMMFGAQTAEEAQALKAGEKQAKERLDELLRKQQEQFDAQVRSFLNSSDSPAELQLRQQPQTDPVRQIKQGQDDQRAQAEAQARRNNENLRQIKVQQDRNEQQRLQALEQQRRNEQQRLQSLEQQRRNEQQRLQALEQQRRNEQQRLQALEQQRRNEQQRLQALEQQRRNDMARTQQWLPPRK